MLYDSSGACITQFLAFVGGCFGFCAKSQPIISLEEPSNGMGIQGQLVRKTSISDSFWSTSTYELENSTIKPQRSMSSITISNLSVSQYSGTGSTSSQEEFVNQGYLRWNQNRLQWLGNKKPENQRLLWKPKLDWDASYECAVEINKRFPCPIPLSEMVDLLVDIWEEDGLYD